VYIRGDYYHEVDDFGVDRDTNYNKKLSYRRETARQLPSSPLPSPPLATPMRMVESETRNKRTSSVPSVKRTLR